MACRGSSLHSGVVWLHQFRPAFRASSSLRHWAPILLLRSNPSLSFVFLLNSEIIRCAARNSSAVHVHLSISHSLFFADIFHISPSVFSGIHLHQIGRASCRERV